MCPMQGKTECRRLGKHMSLIAAGGLADHEDRAEAIFGLDFSSRRKTRRTAAGVLAMLSCRSAGST
jgi:hypothetical protein